MAWSLLVALILTGALVLRILAEILIRLFPGMILTGSTSEIIITRMPGPIGLTLGGFLLVATGFCVGWITGKKYPTQPWFAGMIAGAGICIVEIILSLVKIGTIARLVGFSTGTAKLDWPYSVMLIVVMVPLCGVSAWAAAGYGHERVETGSFSKTLIVVGCTLAGLILLVAAFGFMTKKSRTYTNAEVTKAFQNMENSGGWKGNIGYWEPGDPKYHSLATLEYDGDYGLTVKEPTTNQTVHHYSSANYVTSISYDQAYFYADDPNFGADILKPSRSANVKVIDHFACIWDGKGGTVAEIEAPVKDFPLLAYLAKQVPGSPTLGGRYDVPWLHLDRRTV